MLILPTIHPHCYNDNIHINFGFEEKRVCFNYQQDVLMLNARHVSVFFPILSIYYVRTIEFIVFNLLSSLNF